MESLEDQVSWQQEHLTLFGRRVCQPRLSAWFGDSGAVYCYSGIRLEPHPWTPLLSDIRDEMQELTGHQLNSVLLNWYRSGRDSMGWHSDDEPELGPEPVIASLSLGATRRFQLRHRADRSSPLVQLDLEHGSLLCMAGPTQAHWRHRVPKTRRPVGGRINLTFRRIRIETLEELVP
jgi:alkylated DNA repair dioxygenase AlkB